MLKIIKRIILIIIVILIIVVGKIYLNYENTHLEVSNFNVDASFLDKFDGFTIAHISDFHNETDKKLTDNLVNKIKEAKPLRGGMLLVTFTTGEKRLYDTTVEAM